MKPEELMTGNWVYRHDCYDRVKEIRANGIIGLDSLRGLISFGEIKPIPLTTEILEKNGWSQDIYSNESYDNEDAERLSLWVGEDGRNAWWWHVGVELVIPINYVHQLQNAMTLCGIKKEIEL